MTSGWKRGGTDGTPGCLLACLRRLTPGSEVYTWNNRRTDWRQVCRLAGWHATHPTCALLRGYRRGKSAASAIAAATVAAASRPGRKQTHRSIANYRTTDRPPPPPVAVALGQAAAPCPAPPGPPAAARRRAGADGRLLSHPPAV